MTKIEVQNQALEPNRDVRRVTPEDIKKQQALRAYKEALALRNATFMEQLAPSSSSPKEAATVLPGNSGEHQATAAFAALGELLLDAPPSTPVSEPFAFSPSTRALLTPFSAGFAKALTQAAFMQDETPMTQVANAFVGQALQPPKDTISRLLASGCNVEEMVEVVMFAAAQDVGTDLRAMAEEMRKINAQKVAQRATKRSYRDMRAALEGKMRSELDMLKQQKKIGDGWTFEDYAKWRKVDVSPPRLCEPSPPEIPAYMVQKKNPDPATTTTTNVFGLTPDEESALRAFFKKHGDGASEFEDWLQDEVGLTKGGDTKAQLTAWLDSQELTGKYASKHVAVELSNDLSRKFASAKNKKRPSDPLDRLRDAMAAAKPAAPNPVLPKEGMPKTASAQNGMTLDELQGLEEATDDQLQNTSDMGELQMINLQALMDRRAKLLETLSNIMAKTSNTAAQIIKNFGG